MLPLLLLTCFKNCLHSTRRSALDVKKPWSTLTSPFGTIPQTSHCAKWYAVTGSVIHIDDTQPFDFSFEKEDSTQGMRDLIIDEVSQNTCR